jgi:alpha-L-arabinofuranosidase
MAPSLAAARSRWRHSRTGRAIDAHNSFNDRDIVRPTSLSADLAGEDLNVSLPARSVSVIILKR